MDGRKITYAELGRALGMSASESNASFHRAKEAGLISPLDDRPVKSALAELLIHGLKYMLPVKPGGRTRGMPTGYAAPPLAESFGERPDDSDIPVWPDPDGVVAGLEIRPIFPSVPGAARRDPVLYEWLVLADAMRGTGRAREREQAEAIIRERLNYHAGH